MKIGIDASNILGGGGLTHLKELLKHADSRRHNFDSIEVWCSEETAKELPLDNANIHIVVERELGDSLLRRAFWLLLILPRHLRKCDVLLIPGGLAWGSIIPFVTICQNMLPFVSQERKRYKWGFARIRLEILARLQGRSFKKSSGVIFLSQYARDHVSRQLGLKSEKLAVIPHGVSRSFWRPSSAYISRTELSTAQPFVFIYVSTINVYKHHNNVILATIQLRQAGLPIQLHIHGGGDGKLINSLKNQIEKCESSNDYIFFHGKTKHSDLPDYLSEADAFIFASSCENLPISLLEAMACGLPICCSDKDPMPEILGDNAYYFNSEARSTIVEAMKSMIQSPIERSKRAEHSRRKASGYTWETSCDSTFSYLQRILDESRQQIS